MLTNHQNSVVSVGFGPRFTALRLGPTVAIATGVRRNSYLLFLGVCLALGGGCNSSLTGPDAGGKPCSGSTDCGVGQYCLGFSQLCPTTNSAYTVGVGTCHRDCSAGACSCSSADDCGPGAECDSGRCIALHFSCPLEPTTCPPGCTVDPASDSVCGPICRCEVCPAADAGIPACHWPASLDDAGPGACHASRALISCDGPSGGCECASDDVMACPADTACGLSNGYTTCQDECAAGEYAVACGGPPRLDAGFVDQQPPSGCRAGLPDPGGVTLYCCPCGSS
jgi:hypothetical protein